MAAPGLNFPLSRDRVLVRSSTVDVEHSLTARSTVSARYGRRTASFSSGIPDLTNQEAGAFFGRGVTRYATLRAGYIYEDGEYGSTDQRSRFRQHNLDVGLDYGRQLSFSRRTTFAFGTGSVFLTGGRGNRFHLIGSASLNHQMRRTWTAALVYHRGVEFVQGFGAPVVGDFLNATAWGTLTRRLEARASVGYAMGHIERESDEGYQTYTASTSLQFALSRWAALSSEFTHYRHQFDLTAVSLPGVPLELDRFSARVGLTFSFPLIGR